MQYPSYTEELYYDRAGNRTKRTEKGVGELYKYDPRNRLTEYTKGGVTTQFTYDNAGNLLKTIKRNTPMMHSTAQRRWRPLTVMYRSTATMRKVCGMRWKKTEGLYSSSSRFSDDLAIDMPVVGVNRDDSNSLGYLRDNEAIRPYMSMTFQVI